MRYLQQKRELIGSEISLNLVVSESDFDSFSQEIERFFQLSFAECERIEQKFSRFKVGSELSQLNQNVNVWQPVDMEFFELLIFAEEIRRKSEGYFDITIKSILDSLGYDSVYSFKKSGQLGELGKVELDIESLQVRISAPIDFGGFGKGYALDRIKLIADDFPELTKNLLIDAGGDIYARGLGPDGEFWRIYLEDPLNTNLAIGMVQFEKPTGGFIAASNPGKRNWGDSHHLVNPLAFSDLAKEQGGVSHDTISGVFVQSETSGMEADAWATALFVMGRFNAEMAINKHQGQGWYAILR
jgi:thiamine biosynthesis lipoprotein